MNAQETAEDQQPKARYGAIAAVYLLGLFVGGLYIGMVIPARTVVQEAFGIDSAMGIWMINVYTLFYAAFIPIIGKLADRTGRKPIYIACVALFAAGSALCGLAGSVGGFALLLVGRIVQACGAGGMIPVANAEMGTAFPPEKRGMALGMAAGVMGVSNAVGSAVGSAILGLAGEGNWGMLFFVAVPACALILVMACALLPKSEARAHGKMDIAGSTLFATCVLALLVGIRGIDFAQFAQTFFSAGVLVPLAAAIALGAAFVAAERRAEDPIANLGYARIRQVRITMIVSFFIGCAINSMALIPELVEYALGLPAGEGGYYVAAIGIFAIVGPPLAGKLIDRHGPKPVLMFGLGVMTFGYALFAIMIGAFPSPVAFVIVLAVVGLGMGFAMGAPTNYMILAHTDEADSTQAIAAVTLIRQVGNTISPAILVSFTVAGAGLIGYQQMIACVVAFTALPFLTMLAYK